MTERERLVEEYENAYFAVLMYDLAEREGQQLIAENEKLKNDSEFAVPEAVQMRALGAIRRAFRKEKALAALKHSKLFISKVAVVFLMVSAIFTTAYAAVPEIRASTLNLLIKVSDVSTLLTMTSQNDEYTACNSHDGGTLFGYNLPKIPDGYKLVYTESPNSISGRRFFIDQNDNYICISVTKGIETSLNVDTEDANSIQEISINGLDGLLVEKNAETYAVLADVDNGFYISICSSSLDNSDLLSMLKEIKKIHD